MNGSRTRLVSRDRGVPLPLGHHRRHLLTWHGHEELNPDLNVRSVPSFPLNDAREKWQAVNDLNVRCLGQSQES
jgi:hypothetical protein